MFDLKSERRKSTINNLKGKTAIVTGFSIGTGRVIAEQPANLAAKVVINYSGSPAGAACSEEVPSLIPCIRPVPLPHDRSFILEGLNRLFYG